MGDAAQEAVFRFESPALTIEFEGPEDWVARQIAHFQARMRAALETAVGAAPAAPGDAAPSEDPRASDDGSETPTLEQFSASARSREGRGALQEQILIFAYYLQHHAGQAEVSIDDLNACFGRVGSTPPRSLANTLGIMKRNQGLFESGSGRGRYRLTDDGFAYVRRLVGAQ